MTNLSGQSCLVLINPISGRGLGAELAETIVRAFKRAGVVAEAVMLSGPGSGLELIRERAGGHAAVVAVGGDGTINEIVGAVYDSGVVLPLGIIPLGLSNCLARHWGQPLDIAAAVRVIVAGKKIKADLAWADGRVVLAFLGAGLDAEVVREVSRRRRGPVHNRDYFRAAVSAFRRKEYPGLEVQVDGQAVGGLYYQVILSQISNYARFFHLPRQTGFWVYLFRGSGPFGLIRTIYRTRLTGNLGRAADLALPVRDSLVINHRHGRGFYQYDGEAGRPLPVTCLIKTGAFEVLAP
ncbi:MAG: diacylglycerol kinase family protein [Pseudomonadota bacterium]